MNDVSSQALADRQAIEDVLLGYATALDRRDWPALDKVFSADAVTDYRGIGVFEGRPAVTGVIADFLGRCGATQHMITNIRVALHSTESASAACYLQATHAGKGEYQGRTMTVWGEYTDCVERRAEGWRIVHRTLEVFNVAGDVGAPLKGA